MKDNTQEPRKEPLSCTDVCNVLTEDELIIMARVMASHTLMHKQEYEHSLSSLDQHIPNALSYSPVTAAHISRAQECNAIYMKLISVIGDMYGIGFKEENINLLKKTKGSN
jgi:hypothetical protein